MWGRHACTAALFASLLIVPSAAAGDRLIRIFDQSHGLPTDSIVDVAQDVDGFIWIATPGGLVRFDGAEMRRWPGADRGISVVRTSRDGPVIVLDTAGAVFSVDANGLSPLQGPDGPLRAVIAIDVAASGDVWALRSTDVLRRSPDKVWTSIAAARFNNEPLRHVRADRDGALVLTTSGVWSAGDARRLAVIAHPFDVVRRADGTLFVLAANTVYEMTPDGLRERFQLQARGVALALRGDDVWAGYDRFVVRVSATGPPLIIGPGDGLPSGGHLLVDRERSLWVASFRGLLQFPEPDTLTWTEKDGLPSNHTRFIGRNADGIWVSTWSGLTRIASEHAPRSDPMHAPHLGEVCIDAGGTLWVGDQARLVTIARGRRAVQSWPPIGRFRKCARAADGHLWLGLSGDLVKTGSGPLRSVAHPFSFSGVGFLAPLLEDRAGRLWLGYNMKLCHAPVATLMTQPAWQCEAMPGGRDADWMIDAGDGEYWISTDGEGVYRFKPGETANRWQVIPASRSLGGGHVFKLVPSAAGGVWVMSLAVPTRVVNDPAADGGWRVVETLSGWHGHPTGGAGDLLEEPGGAIWTTTVAGLVRIPAAARRMRAEPPQVRLTDVTVDARPVALGTAPSLTHRQNLVDLRFAALTYRDRARLRYQARLSEQDAWSELATGEPIFRFPRLPAGTYLAEVRASLDGERWSPSTGRLAFQVQAPWYRRAWFIAVLATVLGALLYLAHRARVAVLLNLERQRTRIAMDLHDEMGSGLGSIGILAGIGAAEAATDHQRKDVLREIGTTAGELGASLGDIVWSLRRGSSTLQSCAEDLAQRARRLVPGPEPRLDIQMPNTWPASALPLDVRRNLLLIVTEAVHNAARHAHASAIVVAIERRGRRWVCRVADDGVGCEVSAGADGMGRETMQRRAEEMGATFEWSSARGRGTTVTVTLPPF